MEQSEQHVVIIPSPGMGHLIPLTEFATRLSLLHHFSVTILVPTTGPPPQTQLSVLSSAASSAPSLTYLFLPLVTFHDFPHQPQSELKIVLSVTRSVSHIRRWFDSVASVPKKPVALIVDLFGIDAIDVANDFGVPSYVFFTSSATGLLLFLHTPELEETTSCEYRDLVEPVMLPGCIPVHGRDFPDAYLDRHGHAHQLLVHMSKRTIAADGIILNSFQDLEFSPIKALLEKQPGRPPVYPVGPIVSSDSGSESWSGCLKWLNEQPVGSVLFVSFGSGGTLSQNQLNELAIGLEMSGHNFLLVVRTPNEKVSGGAYFDPETGSQDPLSFLPAGFLERTGGRGMAVASWVPQVAVLSHVSTGGFLSHCGWNSILESVAHGVPVIAWPLYAEQKLNAALLCGGEVKIAVRPEGEGVVGREEVCRVVKELMGGDGGRVVRERVVGLKESAVMSHRQGGSSAESLSELVRKWKSTTNN